MFVSDYYNNIDSEVKSRIDRLKTTDKQAYILLMILYATGCRVSELENVNCSLIITDGKLLIPGLKNSNNREIIISEDVFLSALNIRDIYFYLNIYTASKGSYYTKKYIKRFHVRDSETQPVTHLFRYLFIARRLINSDDIWLIKDIIGHKELTTTQNYINKMNVS